jgi:gamma-glutamyltranspeptidase/glutathione hydrolase
LAHPTPRAAPPLLLPALALPAARPGAAARAGAVATEHQLAAAAGGEVLEAGGSAVDAAVAAAAAVCVVHPSSCGIGGGGFALVHLAGGGTYALDYREVAPAGLRPERVSVDGRPEPSLLRAGGLAVGVPGDVAGMAALVRRFGRLPLARVLEPAIRLARHGFPLADAPHLARDIERAQTLLARDPELRARFLGPDGALPGPDFVVVQADLARTLEQIARDGGTVFYRGPLAAAMATAVQARGGVLTVEDLARYGPRWRRPLSGRFLGRTILTFPPPGSGGVLLEMLGLLADDDLAALGPGTATTLHLLASVMAQGFADRARWYGDPEFTPVPIAALLAPARLHALRRRISIRERLQPTVDIQPDAGTAHVSVLDAAGNAAAITTTINTPFGAGVGVPGTGIILNNEMDDFAIAPEVPNVFGLTGGAANAVAPGKRPQSSMSPTIVLRDGRPELVVGGSGGPTIISGTLQVLLGVLVFGRDPAAAVAAPRIHDQGAPPVLLIEPGFDDATRAALIRIGHRLGEQARIGAVAAAARGPGGLAAAGDARKDGGAVVTPP